MPNRSVLEWDKDDIDRLGILKIDVLALGMLTAIRKSLAVLNQQGINLSPHTLPAEDTKTYEMISRADTVGVFQIESRAQMSMLPRLKPKCFYDLVIEVAIVRPGPIQGGIIHPYLRRRDGKEPISYPNEAIKQFLASTLGIPIFQEQIMQLAVVAAGFTPGEADRLRRTLGSWKRNKSLIKTFGQKLFLGMQRNNYPLSFIRQCLGQIKGFAEYGFPQSHAASFALLVYISAYLKCHHSAAFAVGLLNSQPMGFYQPAQIIGDFERHGGQVLPIDVLSSAWENLFCSAVTIRLGFCLVKGLTFQDAEKLIAFRTKITDLSLENIWRQSGISIHGLRCLARADAWRSLGYTRQEALLKIKTFKGTPLPLLETTTPAHDDSSLPQIAADLETMLDYQHLGFSLKAHPLEFLRPRLIQNKVLSISDLRRSAQGHNVVVAGLVIVRQKPHTAKGTVFFTIEDETGMLNIIVKAPLFQQQQLTLINNSLFVFRGQIQKTHGSCNLLVSACLPLDHLFNHLPGISRDFY